MSLIFAVDSDRKQSAALASLLRKHVNADLVQSGSATEGLNILKGRIPDLILTSSLLSPRDEAALANHLRELGNGASHVHTLTIPVIAAPSQTRKKSQGVLGGLRREKETRTSGCDPEVFAREVALYLDRAVEQRASAEPASLGVAVPEVHVSTEARGAKKDVAAIEPAIEPVVEPVIETVIRPVIEPAIEPAIEPLLYASPAPAAVLPKPRQTNTQTFTASGDGGRAGSALPLEQLLQLVVRNDEGRRVPQAAPAAATPPVEPAVARAVEPAVAKAVEPAITKAVEPAITKAVEPAVARAVEPAVAKAVEPAVAGDKAASTVGIVFVDAAEIAGLSATELAAISAPPRQGRAPDAVPAPEPPAPIVDMGALEDLDLLENRFAAVPLESDPPATGKTISALAEEMLGASSWPWVDDEAGVPLADVLLKACGPVEEVALQPEPEPEPEPELPPTLDLEALEFIGAAAHKASLHALETLARPVAQLAPLDEPADEVEIAPAIRRTRERIVKPERKRRQKAADKPVQDEWGMYDPAQAGPAALIDDDDWEEEPEPVRQPARSRATVY